MSSKAAEANIGKREVYIVTPRETDYIPDNALECKLRYCYAPWGILRWFEFVIAIVILFLITVTCNANACVDVLNEFGRVAPGQGYVFFAIAVGGIGTFIFICLYGTNMHRVAPGAVAVCERVFYGWAIVFIVIAAIVESFYASKSDDVEIRDLGRGVYGDSGIIGNWIAAAVFCWIQLILYIVDFVGQFSRSYPTNFSKV